MKLVAKNDVPAPKARTPLEKNEVVEGFLAAMKTGTYVDLQGSELPIDKARAYVQRVAKDHNKKFTTRFDSKANALRVWAL